MNIFKKLFVASVVIAVAAPTHAAIYPVSGSFMVTLTVYGSSLTAPLTISDGFYDSDTGAGNWSAGLDLSQDGFGTITWSQTFSLNAFTGLGTLNSGMNCMGNAFACAGLVDNIRGPINAGGPLSFDWVLDPEWQEYYRHVTPLNWAVTTPTFGVVTFSEVPVPVAAWLFGSGLLGLGGLARRRS